MGMPTQAGRYIARPLDYTVEESGSNKTLAFICSFELLYFQINGEWTPLNDMQMTGYFYLFQKDGNPNERQIKSLRDALGWDGRSIAGLANGAWSGVEVQLAIGSEEYQGKQKLKIQYINPRDYAPGHIEKNPETVKALASKYDMQLRALAGTAPATGSMPPVRPPVNNPAMVEALARAARKAAWDAFNAKYPDVDKDSLTEDWRAQLKFIHPGKESAAFGVKEWKQVQDAIERPPEPAMAGGGNAGPPFGDESEIDPDSIPF
jgi:hypothetical protein